MGRKFVFYLGHLIRMSSCSRVRQVLTAAGIFVAVAVFAAGSFLTDSYYYGKMRAVEEMSGNVLSVQMPLMDEESVGAIRRAFRETVGAAPVEELAVNNTQDLKHCWMGGPKNFAVTAQVHGVTETGRVLPVFSEDRNLLPVETRLIEGRNLTELDSERHRKVAVIDELAAQLLYPGESAVGKTVTIGGGAEGVAAEVVGVVANSQTTEDERYRAIRALEAMEVPEDGDPMGNGEVITEADHASVRVQVYCPLGTVEEWYPEELAFYPRYYQIFYFEEKQELLNGKAAADYLADSYKRKGIMLTVSTKDYWMEYYRKQLAETRQVLNLATLVLCIISGLSIMSISFFAVKERIPEIGIRKAFGAGKGDILVQMVFEMVSVAFAVSVFAVCASFFACRMMEGYLSGRLYMNFTVHVANAKLLVPVLIGVLEAAYCTIPPAFYAANIRVTDALRFE